jgi:hypothetical protein
MSAADRLNVRDDIDAVCSACWLMQHGWRCLGTTRSGRPCVCSCRARVPFFDCLTAAMPADVQDGSAPRSPARSAGFGAVRLSEAALDRPAAPPTPDDAA